MRPSIDRPRSQDVQFSVDTRLSFRSALRKRRLAFFLLDKIRSFREGNIQGLPTTGVVRQVRRKDCKELERLLANDPDLESYAFRVLNLAFNPRRSRLLYAMAGGPHEMVKDQVVRKINSRLGEICQKYSLPLKNGQSQKTLADHIVSCGSMGIKKGLSEGKKEPDGGWVFPGGELRASCCVLEVAHSQTYGDILDRVLDLLEGTRGQPGMAIIIWFQYNNPGATKIGKTSMFTLFTVGKKRMEDGSIATGVLAPYEEEIIRDEDGNVHQKVFSFTIKDMLGLANQSIYDALCNSSDRRVAEVTEGILAEKIELSSAEIIAQFDVGELTAKDDETRALRRLEEKPNDDSSDPWFRYPRKTESKEPSEPSESSKSSSSPSSYHPSSSSESSDSEPSKGEPPERSSPRASRSRSNKAAK